MHVYSEVKSGLACMCIHLDRCHGKINRSNISHGLVTFGTCISLDPMQYIQSDKCHFVKLLFLLEVLKACLKLHKNISLAFPFCLQEILEYIKDENNLRKYIHFIKPVKVTKSLIFLANRRFF